MPRMIDGELTGHLEGNEGDARTNRAEGEGEQTERSPNKVLSFSFRALELSFACSYAIYVRGQADAKV